MKWHEANAESWSCPSHGNPSQEFDGGLNMVETCCEKLVHIVANGELENDLRALFEQVSVSRVTAFDVKPAQNETTGQILFLVVMAEERLNRLYNELNVYLDGSHQLTVFTANVDVLTPSYFA
jgi:hypothetical protein